MTRLDALRALLVDETDFWSSVSDANAGLSEKWKYARRAKDKHRRAIYRDRMASAGLILTSLKKMRALIAEARDE